LRFKDLAIMPIDFEQARHVMVEQQVRPWEVLDPRVLDVLGVVRREDFVLPRHRKLAFADLALPLEHGEFMLKPIVEGRILQSLDLAPEAEVLEIGTGSGFLTACLSRLARAVTSIDLHADFVERARARLQALGVSNARLEQADAMAYQPGRQFDAVAVTGAVAEVPPHFRQWLKPGGRMFVVRGLAPVQEAIALSRNEGERFGIESLFETDIPYLRGAAPVERFAL
jgi:protein-L-isoaspartate(D-aspartate) O-methyltransferase